MRIVKRPRRTYRLDTTGFPKAADNERVFPFTEAELAFLRSLAVPVVAVDAYTILPRRRFMDEG